MTAQAGASFHWLMPFHFGKGHGDDDDDKAADRPLLCYNSIAFRP